MQPSPNALWSSSRAWVVAMIVASCASPGGNPPGDLAPPSSPHGADEQAKGDRPTSVQDGDASQAEDPTCIVPPRMAPPFFVDKLAVFVTRALSSCTRKNGQAGIRVNSPWIAMALPCTLGPGKIQWAGMFSNPKSVTFALDVGCPTRDLKIEDLQSAGNSMLALGSDARPMAVNPMMVLFWEIQGGSEVDTGNLVALKSAETLAKIWPKLVDQTTTLPVRVYGRENAWVSGPYDRMYVADLDLRVLARGVFQAQVRSATVMTQDEVDTLRTRCQGLIPARDCSAIH